MDSGNSGSLQSSSGGDDDFDAACGGGGADSSASSPLAALLRQQGFGCGGEGGASSLIYGLQELGAPPLSHWCSTTTAPLAVPPSAGAGASAPQPPASLPCHGGGLLAASSAPAADHAAASATPEAKPAAAPPRGSRKRARASRRAPTTVLTTDTSNFRAMVQEFTGIPAPPFAGGGARSRLDHLFPSRSSSSAGFPQYLLRPFAHNVNKQQLHAYPPPPFTSPSTSQPEPATAAVAPGDGYPQQLMTTTAAAPSNNLLAMQDHGSSSNYLSFQSTLGAELHGGDANDNKYPVFDHRGVAPPSSATRLMQDPADFLGLAAHVGVMSASQSSSTLAAAHLHQRNGDELSGLVVGGCKATYSSSARPLLARNGPRRPPPAGASTETTTTTTTAAAAMRTQGVDSWVCTSE